MKTHVSIPINKAIKLLQNGTNIFNGTVAEAYASLAQATKEGNIVYCGCDKVDEKGYCMGHEEEKK